MPANVVTLPCGSILRTSMLFRSATYKFPWASRAMPDGVSKRASLPAPLATPAPKSLPDRRLIPGADTVLSPADGAGGVIVLAPWVPRLTVWLPDRMITMLLVTFPLVAMILTTLLAMSLPAGGGMYSTRLPLVWLRLPRLPGARLHWIAPASKPAPEAVKVTAVPPAEVWVRSASIFRLAVDWDGSPLEVTPEVPGLTFWVLSPPPPPHPPNADNAAINTRVVRFCAHDRALPYKKQQEADRIKNTTRRSARRKRHRT